MTGSGDREALAQGCYFDEGAAERVRRFAVRCCRHTKGRWAGKPFDFLQWQWEDVIRPLFGWRRADGTRRYRQAYIEIPKKNGKSTVCAVLALYFLCADGEPAAEVYSAAKDRQQASIVFREALMMARGSPVLADMLRFKESAKTMYLDSANALYRCLSADAGSQEGLNTHALIFDEYHTQLNRALTEVLEFSGAARSQPLIVKITTAGSDRESVCYDTHRYARQVLSGERIDPGFFAYIRAAEDDDDPDDPTTWAKANPSLGVTISLDSFRDDWQRAKRSADAWDNFRRYRLNQWVENVSAWLPVEVWDACSGEPAFPDGTAVFGGLDMSSTTDLTAFVEWCPETGGVRPHFWAPEEAFKARERKNKPRIDQWAASGHIKVIPGSMIDHNVIFQDIVEICRGRRVEKIGADPYNAVDLLMRLSGEGGLPVAPFRQGMLHMSGPTKWLEAALLDGRLRHGGHPVLRWNFKNVAIKTDESENKRPAKNKCADKIDGIVALIMAAGVALSSDITPSVYEKGGL